MALLTTIRRTLGMHLLLVFLSAPVSAQSGAPQAVNSSPSAVDPVQRRVVEYQGKSKGIEAGEAIRSTESTKRLAAREQEIAELSSQLTVALSMPPASPERTDRIDQTFSALTRLVERLRNDRAQAVSALAAETTKRDANLSALTEDGGTSRELATAIRQYREIIGAPVLAVEREIDTASSLLSDARVLRRRAEAHASAEIREQTRTDRFREAASEIQSIPIDIMSSIRQTLGEWWQAPKALTQVQALGSLFLGLLEVVLLLVVGVWMHGRIPRWTHRILRNLDREEGTDGWSAASAFPPWMVAGEISALFSVVSPIVQDLLVMGISVTLMMWLSASLPLLAWVALVFAAGACIRLAQGVVELALITPAENRPGLRVTDEGLRAALLWLIKVFGLLFAIDLLINRLLVDILAADRVAELLSELTTTIALLIAIVGLHKWGATIRGRVTAGGAESNVATWATSSTGSVPAGILTAALSLVILMGRLAFALAHGLVESRAGLSWVGAALARRQLREDPAARRPILPLATRTAIGQGSLRTLHVEPYITPIATRYQEWCADPRRGLVAITGDRGCGKSVVMEGLQQSLDAHTIHAQTPIGARTPARALQWLIETTDIDAEPSVEAVVEALMHRPAAVILLSNLHRLYLRTVNGYEGLDVVLAVMQATGRHHFWVASFHGPAWSFLAEMKHIGNVGVFTTRVDVKPLNPADLSAWLLTQTRAAGFRPRFEGMLPRRITGPDAARMMERTERAYWRLLTEASQGNPTVAVRMWVEGLRATDAATSLDVTIPRTHDTQDLDTLEDSELFALTALILHDDMDVTELHRVLNIRESQVRSICRTLEQLTLITETDLGRYKVRLTWLPAVERHLRRRSFLHKG